MDDFEQSIQCIPRIPSMRFTHSDAQYAYQASQRQISATLKSPTAGLSEKCPPHADLVSVGLRKTAATTAYLRKNHNKRLSSQSLEAPIEHIESTRVQSYSTTRQSRHKREETARIFGRKMVAGRWIPQHLPANIFLPVFLYLGERKRLGLIALPASQQHAAQQAIIRNAAPTHLTNPKPHTGAQRDNHDTSEKRQHGHLAGKWNMWTLVLINISLLGSVLLQQGTESLLMPCIA
ncbi:hypothetical protein Q31a_54220 [Aureliella helgolandensis]|uniref:Uncharacterized protein n=1 Tax=Aureliella helgolandensis TaxID=2527968 RepID=A0A518GEL3_9BACT|nr:hypothetical protein Q31a_54220 [Aureliella helgolandensis]